MYGMNYWTIKEIIELAKEWNRQVVDVWQENKYVVVVLNNGVRIKLEDFKM